MAFVLNKIKSFTIIILCITQISFAQTLFWTEDFGFGCNQGQYAAGFTSINGTWFSVGGGTTSGSDEFFVSATEAGMGQGNCSNGCISTSTLNNRTLHVGTSPVLTSTCQLGDCGAIYDPNIPTPSLDAESPNINCTGKYGITLSFDYLLGGQSTNTDYGELQLHYLGPGPWYVPGWNSWIFPPKTQCANASCTGTATCNGINKAVWSTFTLNVPAGADNYSNFKLRFRWHNNGDSIGTRPSFAIDNINLSASIVSSIQETSTNKCCELYPNPAIYKLKINSSTNIETITITDIFGKTILHFQNINKNEFEINTSSLALGVYFAIISGRQSTNVKKFVKQ